MLVTRRAELRKRPQQARSSFTFDAILDAAERIVVTEGLKALQMSALGRRAGVSAGSLYQYFTDRRSILQALSERSSTRFLADLKLRCEALRDADLDGFLYLLSCGLAELASREHRLSRVLREELGQGAPLGEVRDLTEEAVAAGVRGAAADAGTADDVVRGRCPGGSAPAAQGRGRRSGPGPAVRLARDPGPGPRATPGAG